MKLFRKTDVLLKGTPLLWVIQFIIFKQLYPFGDYVADSYAYIYAAKHNLDVYLWPIGYSRFLLYFHGLTHSEMALVAFQYFFLETAALYFFYTIQHFYKLSRELGFFLYVFLFVNPLFLYLSNCIGSDALFIGLSLLWISQVIWMLHRPRWFHVLTQAVLIWLTFTLRYNALYYPLITAAAFVISPYRLSLKLVGILLPVICVVAFMDRTIAHNAEVTGTGQFSVFGGWQTANNALFLYPHIQVDSNELPSTQSILLNRVVRHYFDTVAEDKLDMDLDNGSFYMWDAHSPLKIYMHRYVKQNGAKDEFDAWGQTAPVFSEYGSYIIKANPGAYITYYLWPNTKEYFLPNLEKLAVYNMDRPVIDSLGTEWFEYKSPKVSPVSYTIQGHLLAAFPQFFLMANVLYIVALVWFLLTGGQKNAGSYFNKAIFLITVFLLANYGFSVLAAPIVFRYQLFPMILLIAFALLLVDFLYKFYQHDKQRH